MHTPVRSQSPNNAASDQPATSSHKEYGDVTTMCTQCNRVLLPPLTASVDIPIRVSREEDEHWIDFNEMPVSKQKRRMSHGLCRACFNNIDADLISSAPLSSRTLLSKSLSSPQFSRHLPSRPKRILIVDDNRLQRQIHKRMIEQAGYECDSTANGAEALELIQKHSYFLVLMDLVMSPMDGYTTAKKIRLSLIQSLGFSSSMPKIIACTGMHVDEKLTKQCRDSGMDDVVQKPINTSLLNKVLHKHSGQPAMKLDS